MNELELALPHRRSHVARRLAAFAFPIVLVLAGSPAIAAGQSRARGGAAAWGTMIAPQRASDPLRVRVEPSIDDANLLSDWIKERHRDAAEKVPVVEAHQQWISVEIGGATYDYRVSVVAMRDGAPLGAKKEPEVCECTSEKLLQMIDEQIAAAVEELRAAAAPERGQEPESPEPKLEPDSTTDGESSSAQVDDRHRSLGTMGYVGIGLGVLGAGMLAGGIPLAIRPDELRGDPGTLSSYSTRPPGIGLAAGGGAVLAAGVALIVVDVVRHRKASIAVVPAVGRGHAGVFIVRKF